jgi:hypothetical protein
MRALARTAAFVSASLAALAAGPSARAQSPAAAESLVDADRLWAERALDARGGEASAPRAAALVASCRKAVELDPGSLEPRWRLMRALYFQGEHATTDAAEKKKIFDDGKKAGETSLEMVRQSVARATGRKTADETPVQLAPDANGIPGIVPTFLWAGIDWGKWALVFGKTEAARKGAADKIRDYAAAVVLLDPSFESGAGYRVLGRLHHQTPAIPFFTMWASRSEALKNLRLAYAAGPKHFYNRLYLADATWDYEKEKRSEARRMLEELVADTPSADYLVEDRRAQEDARALLAAWAK